MMKLIMIKALLSLALCVSVSMSMTYEGCYIDDASRDLPNRWWNTDEMTLELCASHCIGYTFMATQYSRHCFCGNSFGHLGEDADGCAMECAGDSSQMCGDGWRNSVYRIRPDPVAAPTYIGCFIDTADRDIPDAVWNYGRMTVESCAAHCQGYSYMGLQASSYCFCGDSYGSFGEVDGCSFSCHGDSSQTCGGSWRNSVYSLNTEVSTTMEYVGCFIDNASRDLPELEWSDAGLMTNERCAAHCTGYAYFGTQYSSYCFCGNSFGKLGEDANGCTMTCTGDSSQNCGDSWRNSVYQIAPALSASLSYVGCFVDTSTRDVAHNEWSDAHMTIELCAHHCQGYRYMAVQYSSYCFCGDSYGLHGDDPSGCDMDCSGDATQSCGSSWRNSVYKILADGETDDVGADLGQIDLSLTYVGCYIDSGDRDLPHRYWSDSQMTNERCAAHCTGYSYFGTQFGIDCFCGNSFGRFGEDSNGCNMLCSGDSSHTCGASMRNSIYQIAEPISTPMTYVGCFFDDASRDLPHHQFSHAEMTYELCARHCQGYQYMALQYSSHCFCGDSYGRLGEDSTGCNMDCAGDSSVSCGSGWRNSVFELDVDYQPVDFAVTYVGCFVDASDRDLPALMWSDPGMTNQRCAAHCSGYSYFSTQYSSYCFCGNSFGKHGEDANGCTMTCTGDSSQNCGDSWRNSVYQIAPALSVTVGYVGCFIDDASRDIPHHQWWDNHMTLELCANHCEGYQYMGLQYAQHCFCGDTYGRLGEDPSGCNMDCAGDSSQSCGDSWRNSVFELNGDGSDVPSGIVEDDPDLIFMGCFIDGGVRDLPDRFWSDQELMTNQRCAAHCEGYAYMGTQYGYDCFCGNSFGKYGEDSNGCTKRCTGDNTQKCGASFRNSVYQIAPVESTPKTFVGCFIDDGSRDLPHQEWSNTYMTYELCARHCQGYQYMALQYGSYCFCGDSYGSLGEDPTGCTMDCSGDPSVSCGSSWRNSVFELEIPVTTSMMMDYVGCFIDSGDRDLPVHHWYDDDMTIEKCAAHCQGYVYAGTQYSSHCFCGNLLGKYGEDSEGCNMECSGDSSEKCGDSWRNSVYQIAPVRAAPVSYLGCFIDNASRDLPYMHYSDTHMSIELCAHHCRGFQYMSLQYGSHCFCGDSYGTLGEDPSGCNMNCAGDVSQTCGDGWRNSVYELVIPQNIEIEHLDFPFRETEIIKAKRLKRTAKLFIPNYSVQVQAKMGTLVKWYIRTFDTKDNHLSVWRPTSLNETSFTYVGGTDFTSDVVGEHEIELDNDSKIPVLQGDVLGLYRSATAPFYYNRFQKCKESTRLVYTTNNVDQGFTVGQEFDDMYRYEHLCGDPYIAADIEVQQV